MTVCWEDIKTGRELDVQSYKITTMNTSLQSLVAGDANRVRIIIQLDIASNQGENAQCYLMSDRGTNAMLIGQVSRAAPTAVLRVEEFGPLLYEPLAYITTGGTISAVYFHIARITTR